MNTRTRFGNLMKYGPVDRGLLLEEGLRDEVWERWRSQGMPETGGAGLFTYDKRVRIEVDSSLRDKGVKGPLRREELPAWRRNLERPPEERLGTDWAGRCAAWRTGDQLLELQLHSGLLLTLGVHDWSDLESVMYLLADERAVAQEAMELQGELAVRVARRVMADVNLDMVSLSEPISDNHGPLVGPAMYRELALRNYAGVLELVRGRVPATVFMTYGNARVILPEVIAAGFSCLWAMETETRAMDYRDLRKEFGKELRLIGGIDLDSLLAGPAAVEREMQEKVPGLLRVGGYIPLADGRVRATVSWAAYLHYRRLLEVMVRGRRDDG